MSNKKDKLIALVAAIVFHALLLLLLAFLTIHKAKIDKEREDGVPVLLGQVEDAAGEDMGGLLVDAGEAEEDVDGAGEHEPEEESVPVAPVPHKSQPKIEEHKPAKREDVAQPEKKSDAKPVITQDKEKSVTAEEAARKKAAEEAAHKKAAEDAARKKAAEEAAHKKAAEEAARKKAAEEAARKKAAEEAARKKAAEEAAKAAVNNRVAGAFGSGGNKGDSGNTSGKGNQGSATGNSNVGSSTGQGGLGTGTTARVGNRTVVYLARPAYADSQSEGTVIVAIRVDAAGKVISASVTRSTTSSALKSAAVAAAKQSKFSEGNAVESGTITYRFKLK